MNSVPRYRFQTAIGVLMLAASSLVAGCSGGDEPATHAASTDGAGSGSDGGDGNGGAVDQPGAAGQAGSRPGVDLPLNGGEYTVESFGAKDERPADFQPLNDAEAVLLKRDETAIVYGDASLSGLTLDDAGQGFAPKPDSLAPQLKGLTPLELTSANVDDDGADEIAVLGTTSAGLVLRVIDHAADELYASHEDVVLADQAFTVAHVRAGDLDGDGRAELVVSASNGSQAFARVYDNVAGKFGRVKELVSGAGKEIALAVGNFDADRELELALLSDGDELELRTLDDARRGFSPLRRVVGAELPLPTSLRARGVALEAGNFDSDATDELVVLADGYDTQDPDNWIEGLYAGTLQDAADDVQPIELAQSSLPAPTSPSGDYRKNGNRGWQATVADMNGDGRAELVVLERLPNQDGKNFDFGVYRFSFDGDERTWQTAVDYLSLVQGVSAAAPGALVTVGQTEGLGRDLLVTVHDDAGPEATLATHRVFASHNDATHLLGTGSELKSAAEVVSAAAVWPVSGDFDGDSLRVRFTGKKWLELTRPRPIVVLAAPPAKAGTSQVTDNNATSYGTSRSVEQGTTEEYSITRKVTLSFELPIPGLDFLNVGASASMSKAMSESNTHSLEDSYGMQYAASYPDNVVVFNGVLCMRYEYRVLGGADTALIGSLMTIDVPIDSRIYKWTTAYYNQALGDRGSPIDSSVLPQDAGDPSTFPNVQQRDKLMRAAQSQARSATVAWKSDPISVGQGQGANSVWIDLNQTDSKETAFTTSTEYSASAGAFISAEYSQGVDETAAYSVSVTRGTEFQGSVGDIADQQDYADWFFSYGLFVYPATLAKGEKVQIVNYWTEGFGPGYRTK